MQSDLAPASGEARLASTLAVRGRALGSRIADRWVIVGAVLAVLVVIVGLIRLNPMNTDDPVFSSPRQAVTWTFAERLSEGRRPTFVEPLLVELPGDLGVALTPRDAASLGDEILPKDFPLNVVAYTAALRVHPMIARAMNPVFGGLLVVATAALAHQLSRSRLAAALAGGALLTTISFWMTSGLSVSTDSLAVAALLMGIVVLLRAGRSDEATWWRHPLLAGLLFALSATSRYVIVFPVAIAVLTLWIARRIRLRTVVTTAAVAAVALLPVLAYHAWLYGGPLKTGYALGDALLKERVRFEGRGLLSFDVGRFLNHLRLYVGRIETILLAATALWGVRSTRRSPDARALAIAAGIITIVFLGYHGGQGTWGATEFSVNSSILRYLLPVFALASVYAGIGLARLRGDALTVAVAGVAVLIAATVWTTWSGPAGFGASAHQNVNQRAARDWIVDQTPEDALVVTRLGSKTLFPHRRALTATFMLDGSRVVTDREILVWEVVPTPQELADDLALLAEAGHPTYLYNDGFPGWLSPDELDAIRDRLGSEGVELIDRSKWSPVLGEGVELYEVSVG